MTKKTARKPRPHLWKSGSDPVRHAQYKSWLQKRNQAQFRGESWQLSFEDFVRIWADQWHRQGRWRDCLQMMRDNFDRPWSPDNVVIVNRDEFHRRQSQRKQALSHRRKVIQQLSKSPI